MHDLELDVSRQLQHELEASVVQALSTSRPILTHWNADTTWSLSLAYPSNAGPPSGRLRYNILIDPWLAGPQSDVAGWFSTQWHAIRSSVQTVAELNEHLEAVEFLASQPDSKSKTNKTRQKRAAHVRPQASYIDALVISHEFTDHCHKTTLLEVDQRVPVFATSKAVQLIRSWNHFDVVHDVAIFTSATDWRTTSQDPLPSWLGISRLITKSDALYYHSAIIICFEDTNAPERAEAVIYTPHGVEAESFASMISSKPPIQTLAFLHGLHDVSIALSKQLNLGAHNALKAQRILNSNYWVGTHDEVKIGGGLIAPFLRRKAYSMLDALGKETPDDRSSAHMSSPIGSENVTYVDLGNGESLLLE